MADYTFQHFLDENNISLRQNDLPGMAMASPYAFGGFENLWNALLHECVLNIHRGAEPFYEEWLYGLYLVERKLIARGVITAENKISVEKETALLTHFYLTDKDTRTLLEYKQNFYNANFND